MDQVWYFARNDEERGPYTGPQMQALVAAGKLRDDDLIWKEGMSEWAPAAQAKQLLTEVAAPQPPPQEEMSTVAGAAPVTPERTEATNRRRRNRRPSTNKRSLAYMLAAIGFLGVLSAKGCEGLTARNVDRLAAIVELQQRDFGAQWDAKRTQLQEEQQAIQQSGAYDAAAQRRLNEINLEISELSSTEQKTQRSTLQNGRWQEQREAAEAAKYNDRIWGFWRQLAFLGSVFVFSAGLLMMSTLR